MTHPFDLSGRRVLVTGASSGLGREAAVLLSELGASVIAHGRSEDRLAETMARLQGSGHRSTTLDLEDIDAIPDWVQGLAADSGSIDGFVHSAGVSWAQPLRTWSRERHERLMRINLTSAIACARTLRHPKVRGAAGAIVFLSSIAGVVGIPALADYSASKGALISLTRSLALELARDGIRVNCVAPGLVADVGMAPASNELTNEQRERYFRAYPLGPGRGRDVAGAVAFLLSPAARWITGVCLGVDGGMAIA